MARLQGVASLAISRSDPDVVYAATNAVAGHATWVHTSADRGMTWSGTRSPLACRRAFEVSVDPQDPEVAYAGRPGAIVKTTDGGRTWTQHVYVGGAGRCFGQTAVGVPTTILVDPSRPSRLYVSNYVGPFCEACIGRGGGLFVSEDGGLHWSRNEGIGQRALLSGVYLSATDPDTIYVTAGHAPHSRGSGVLRSTDGGKTWRAISRRLPPRHSRLAVDPTDARRLYLGASRSQLGSRVGTHAGIYTSTDAGTTWQLTHELLPQEQVEVLAIDPADPSVVFAGLGTERRGPLILESDDAGATWHTLLRTPGEKTIWSLVIDPGGRRLLAVIARVRPVRFPVGSWVVGFDLESLPRAAAISKAWWPGSSIPLPSRSQQSRG